MRGLLREGRPAAELQPAFDAAAPRLGTFAPELRDAIAAQLKEPGDPAALAAKLDAFFANPPDGYYPPERMQKLLERVKAQGVEGVVVFSAGGIGSAGLWPTVEQFYGQ